SGLLAELIDDRPAIVENCFSSGSATADAIVSGLAPGSEAVTWMVGKSMFGRSLTGSSRYAIVPNTTMPIMIRVVVTGRSMKSEERFIDESTHQRQRACTSFRDAVQGASFRTVT